MYCIDISKEDFDMLRRSLFRMLLGNSETTALTKEVATKIDIPAYLKRESIRTLVQTFDEIKPQHDFELPVSTAFAFRISWSFDAFALGTMMSLQLGLKEGDANIQLPIPLGIHADGHIYIGSIKDKRVLTLAQGQQLQLLLEVHPQGGNLTHARLTLRDAYGLTLATVKNRNYAPADWSGNLFNAGPHLNDFKIEGSIQT